MAVRDHATLSRSQARPQVRVSRAPLSGLAALVLVVGVVVTAALTISSRLSYIHNESRLTQLQSALTADALGVAPVDVERRLGQALSAASQSPNPVAAFHTSIAASMAPKGPFTSASLSLVRGSKIKILALAGQRPLRPLTSRASVVFFDQVAKSPLLVTTRVVSKNVQRLGFGLEIRTKNGALVAAAGEELPLNRVTTVPSSSPDYGFNVAIYFGKTTAPSSLLIKTTNNLPIQGTVARVSVPFGSSTLTLVMSPKRPLTGTWSALLPWGILVIGLLFTLGVASLVERLVRRRRTSDSLVEEVGRLYDEQRAISETLQRSLLPKELPSISGVAFAGRYLPGQRGTQVGGDWYSVVESDEGLFTFVVGDVSGRGVSAAAVMASLRYTTRTLASLGYPPSEILQLTSKELSIGEDGHFATVLVGQVDRGQTLKIASAGHYPPILVSDGESEFVEMPIGLPLGLKDGVYESCEILVPARACLLAFTDGLFERRNEDIDVGLKSLLSLATEPNASIDDRVDGIITSLVGSEAEDDTAILGIQWLS